MRPIDFPESNIVFDAPVNMPGCQPLKAYADRGGIWSCWELTEAEKDVVMATGRLWVCVVSNIQPPMAMQVEMPFGADAEFPSEIEVPEK